MATEGGANVDVYLATHRILLFYTVWFLWEEPHKRAYCYVILCSFLQFVVEAFHITVVQFNCLLLIIA